MKMRWLLSCYWSTTKRIAAKALALSMLPQMTFSNFTSNFAC